MVDTAEQRLTSVEPDLAEMRIALVATKDLNEARLGAVAEQFNELRRELKG